MLTLGDRFVNVNSFLKFIRSLNKEKMSYVAAHVKNKADIWFDSHMIEKKGTNWPLFCAKVCIRFGSVRPIDIVDDFNNLKQTGSVEGYQKKFEEPKSYVLLVTSLLNDIHFISSYVIGLKPELKPLVGLANPICLIYAFDLA